MPATSGTRRLPALGVCVVWIAAWWSLYPVLGPKAKAYGLARLGSAADYFFTYMGPELLIFLFGLVVLPLVYYFVLRRLQVWVQVVLAPVLLAGFMVIAYYDVVQIARQAEHLCTTEAGLRVYKTVEAEGIYGLSDIEYWSKYGFKWLESSDGKGGFVRATIQNSKKYIEKIASPSSRFEYVVMPNEVISPRFERSRTVVRNRLDQQVLGESIEIYIFRGWADRAIDFGFNYSPPICWDGPPLERGGPRPLDSNQLIQKLVNPLRKSKFNLSAD